MPGNINANLTHHFNGLWSNITRLNASAQNFKAITGHLTQQAFSHLAARRVSGAENQDALFISHLVYAREIPTGSDASTAHVCAPVSSVTQHIIVPARLSSSTTKPSHSLPSGSC